MKHQTQVILFGSLRKRLVDRDDHPVQLDLETPTGFHEVLSDLEIPIGEVQLLMVNHRAVPMDSTIQPGDRLALFPREYPFFYDWNDLRSRSK
jgi:hypothetical protein